MIKLKNKKECTGCAACYNICPTKCIEMEADKEGFKYPFVDKGVWEMHRSMSTVKASEKHG